MPLAPVLAVAGQEGSGLVSSSYHVYGRGSNFSFEGPVQFQQAAYKDLFLDIYTYYVYIRALAQRSDSSMTRLLHFYVWCYNINFR